MCSEVFGERSSMMCECLTRFAVTQHLIARNAMISGEGDVQEILVEAELAHKRAQTCPVRFSSNINDSFCMFLCW